MERRAIHRAGHFLKMPRDLAYNVINRLPGVARTGPGRDAAHPPVGRMLDSVASHRYAEPEQPPGKRANQTYSYDIEGR